jgi:hypothetical protein
MNAKHEAWIIVAMLIVALLITYFRYTGDIT